MTAVHRHIERWPEVRFDVFQDDIAFSTVENTRVEAVENIVVATEDFINNVNKEAKLIIEKQKSSIVSSSPSAAKSAARSLGLAVEHSV